MKLNPLKLLALIIGALFITGGASLVVAQAEKSTDPVEKECRRSRKR